MIFNQIKTIILLGALTGLMLLVGNLIGGKLGLTVALIFAILMNSVMYFFSDKIALMWYRAEKIKQSQYPWLYSMIKELAKEANIPEPKGIYLIPAEQANAFCAGRGPNHYVVACTKGILDLLTKEELNGVLAHEISHAKNRDVLIATLAATIAGVISYIAHMAQFAAFFGGTDRDSNQSTGNLVGLLILAILTPIIALIIQMAISRSREYLADETGARLVGDANPLAKALEKIHGSVKNNPLNFGSEAASGLFIANPFKGNFLINLFSTHPSLESRLNRLKELKLS